MKIEVEGIVIKQTPYKEKDAMISLLTKNGMVSFLAHNVLSLSSKYRSSCLPFTYSIFTLNSKLDKLSLSQAKIIKSYMHFYNSLESLTSINLVNECICKFIDEDNTYLFEFLKNFLELLDRGFDEITLTAIMIAQIVKNSGYDLEYNSCVKCSNKKNIVGISYTHGGFVCKNCFDNQTLKKSKEYLKTFRYLFMIPPDKMAHYVIDSSIGFSLIEEFCSYLSTSFGLKEIKALEMYKNSKK